MSKYAIVTACALLCSLAVADVIDTESQRSFSTPTSSCKITIPKGDFLIVKEQINPAGTSAYYALGNEKELINYSFYIDTNSGVCGDSSACLDVALSNKAYKNVKEIKRYEHAGFSVAEFNIEFPGKDGVTITQKNVLAENYQQGCWVDIHLSKVGIGGSDVKGILTVLGESKVKK
jgi:hypothetical protein